MSGSGARGGPPRPLPGQSDSPAASGAEGARDQWRADDSGFDGPGRYSPVPKLVGDYQLVARLSGGSMAELYVARKVSQFGFVHRAVIKQVKRSRPDFRQLQRMLLDEARATACFDHPNLVKIYDVGESEAGLYLALEYVDGTDLRRVNQKLRARKEALPFELACHIVAEVLRGVHHAHTARGPDGQPLEIVHRDVNPSNVLVATSGHVKLADFGVVRMRERIQPKTEPGLVKGKYAYLAPEYIAGESCSVQTDVYAAGIMLFELLSGRECFTGTSAYEVMWKIVNKGVPMYRLQREGVPEDLQRLVARSTSMVPERRYGSAQDMANALEAWLMRAQKHATPWVLSVFFHRHDLFQRPMDHNYQPLAEYSTAGVREPPPPPSRGEEGPGRDVSGERYLQSSPARGVVDDSLTPTPELAGLPPVDVERNGDFRFFSPSGPATSPPLPGPDQAPAHAGAAAPSSPPAGRPLTSPPILGPRPRAPTTSPSGSGLVGGLGGGLMGASDGPAAPIRAASALPTQPAMPTSWVRGPEEHPLMPPEDIGVDDGPTGDLEPDRATTDHTFELSSGPDPHQAKAGRGSNGQSVPPSAPPAASNSVEPIIDTSDLSAPAVQSSLPPGEPIRAGKLEEHPAVDILEHLAADGSSGIVEFRCGLIWKRVLISEGKPTGVTSNMGMELIGEHLVKARIISREDLERALQNSERLQKPLTFCLLEETALTRETLEVELGRNLGARLQEVLEWRWGTYEFTAQTMAKVEILPRLDLQELLANARVSRARQDSAAADAAQDAPASVDAVSNPQTKLKEALRVARSIAKSTGKGRVDRPWRNPKP